MDARLAAMINFVREGDRVADIGTDHGYLPIELARRGKVSRVIAADKNPGPLAAAKKNISAAGLEKIIEVRQGDGLKILRAGEVETICMGGMGGKLITEILAASLEVMNSAERLILQPMNAAEKVRAFLAEQNWFIADEDLAEEGGIVYEIILAVREKNLICSPTRKETSPLLEKFFEQKAKKIRRVLDEMKKSPSAVRTGKFLSMTAELEKFSRQKNSPEGE